MNENNLSYFLREVEQYVDDNQKADFQRVVNNINKNAKMRDILLLLEEFHIDQNKIKQILSNIKSQSVPQMDQRAFEMRERLKNKLLKKKGTL